MSTKVQAAMVIGTALLALACEKRSGERPTSFSSERTAQIDLADAGGAPSPGAAASAPPTAVGGGPPADLVFRDEVALRVAAARCDRLQACGAIGFASGHASREACLEAERARAVEAWDLDTCTRMDATSAAACVDAARTSSCDTMFNPLFVPLVGGCAASTVCPTDPALTTQ